MKSRALAPLVVVTTVVAGASLAAALPARAAPKMLGWAPSGAMWFQQMDGAAPQVCREDPTDVPTGWPEGVTIGPGVACADLPEKLGEKKALDFVKAELKGTGVDKKNAFGLEVRLDTPDAKGTVIVLNGAEIKEAIGQADGKGAALKIGDVAWRKDGKAVAVTVVADKAKEPSFLFVKNVEKLLVGGPAGKNLAARLTGQAQGLMKKRDWSGAGRMFEAAIAADASFAPARYGRAAAEAQGGVGRTAMIENLTWLKENGEKDKLAKKLLDDAKKDTAFDAWVGEPEVRDLLGLPKVSAMDVPARILERKALWSIQGTTCKSPWLTLSFKGDGKGGGVTLTVAESCKGKKTQKTAAGTWKKDAAGAFVLEMKKLPEGVLFPASATLRLDEGYQQMKLVPASGEPLGTFEPGGARIDDSTL